jgi:hypothetical protein
MFTENSPKIAKQFICEKCNYKCCKRSDWNKHISTRKHKNVYSSLPKCLPELAKISENKFSCQCGKEYKHKQSLYVHRKKCNINEDIITDSNSDNKQLTAAILQIVTNNDEFKKIILDQQKQLIELAKSSIPQMGNNNNINSHNKFNINVFLNEKCKDALNISDFVSQLNIGVKDLEETGRLGFADGISKIFINGLNQLDIYNKPLHCNDSKREVLYIKDSDKWTKEEEGKPILTKAIKEVASKNIKQIFEWQKLHSEYNDPSSKQNDKYLQIVCESMSGSTKEESEKNYNKIIRKLAKETVIPEIEK